MIIRQALARCSFRVSIARRTTIRWNSSQQQQSPLSRFIESIKEQVEKNRELQQNLKQLQDESSKLSDSESLRKAKELYQKTKEQMDSEQVKQVKQAFQKTAQTVSTTVKSTVEQIAETPLAKTSAQVIGKTADTVGIAAEKVGQKISSATEPIRKTQLYTSVRDQVEGMIEDDTGRYVGYQDKEARKQIREKIESNQLFGKHRSWKVAEDPEAGEAVILHKDAAWKTAWNHFKEGNPLAQSIFRIQRSYSDSDHPMVQWARSITDRVQDTFAGWFSENETALTVKKLQETVEPNFSIEKFMRFAREYVIPEVLDAYLSTDLETLRVWCSEATFNVLTSGVQAQIQQGLVSDSKILDLRDVELVAAKLLENDIPVLVLSFQTQEIIIFRNRQTKEIVYGKEDHIEQVTYACVLTKTEEDLGNPITGGWRVIDMAKRDSRPTW